MTALTVAIANELSSDETLQPLLGSTPGFGPWVFTQTPFARVENTQKCLIVVVHEGSWATANDYNTEQFPRIAVDIWADPQRNGDRSVALDDTEDKIEAVLKIVKKHLHRVSNSNPDGTSIFFGPVRIHSTKFTTGPEIFPISDGNGGQMGRSYFNIAID